MMLHWDVFIERGVEEGPSFGGERLKLIESTDFLRIESHSKRAASNEAPTSGLITSPAGFHL
jgi:hypothetical protein